MISLVTGGAGFIGSHLVEDLLKRGDTVIVIDDLSTGSIRNIDSLGLERSPRLVFVHADITNSTSLPMWIDRADMIFHLAASVGVRKIIEEPTRTIETNVQGTALVLRFASVKSKPVFIASTSEVYGKSRSIPFTEDGDSVFGPTVKSRWSYACSKALDEFLALAYAQETGLPVVIGRLFNTVGPRQTGRYGMVLPTFIDQAMSGRPLTVYGTGKQTRCFGYVKDAVSAILKLMDTGKAYGQVVNIGNDKEISIEDLAIQVKEITQSPSPLHYISYDEAYASGFEDMVRRVPSLEKLEALTGFRPTTALAAVIKEIVNEKLAQTLVQ
jgi:UDP-glucose 4-epimerase